MILMSKPTEMTDAFSVTVQIPFLPWLLLNEQLYSCTERAGLEKLLLGRCRFNVKSNFFFPLNYAFVSPCYSFKPKIFLGRRIVFDSITVSSPTSVLMVCQGSVLSSNKK